jgi:hypothetical protein
MKNLPEDELFNFVENRLRNYSELPDDEGWDRISGAIISDTEPKWIVWTNRTAAALSLVILFFLLNGEYVSYGDASKEILSNISHSKKKVDLAPSTISSKTELKTPEPRSKDNREKAASPVRSLNHSEDEYYNEQEVPNINSGQLVIGEKQEEESLMAVSPANHSTGRVHAETFRTDSMLIAVRGPRKDSAASVESVRPPSKKRKKSKLTLYSMISPSLSFQHVTPESADGVVVDKLNSPGVISHERFGISIETGLQGQITERFQYIVGLSFYRQSQQISYEEKSDGTVIESGDDLNYDIKPSTTTRTFDYSMGNIGVQAGILYTLKQRGLIHKAGVVIQYQKGLIQANEGDVYDNSSSDYLNYQFLYRVEYAFRSGVGLFIQPAYTHSIIANESLDAPFKLKQSRASLGIGVVYRF